MAQRARIERGKQVLAEKSGQTKTARRDGYVNMLNKYGTTQDNSTAYTFQSEPLIPDMQLTEQYEMGGLFAKIIDAPAEEAVKHGFNMGLKSPDVETYVTDTLDWLDWEEKAATAIKWSRLFGGAIIVMLINDGRGVDEPIDWQAIKSIDELRVYERAIVQPDYTSLYSYDPQDPLKRTASRFGMPEYYQVFSMFGTFVVHESRCLILRNGILPERTTQAYYRFWGTPEFVRIRKELREAITSHSLGVKMLERSVQAIYSMKNLAQLLATDEGEDQILKRLQVIDMARGILNSIAIDSEGESYDFKNIQLSGVKDVLDSTCNMLSAVTNIPQTILFGRSPAGENSTGESDFENYYNYVERIQKMMLRGNLKTLIDVVVRAGFANGKIEEEPDYRLAFNPLWSMSDSEQATVDQTRAQTQQTKAQTAQMYVDMGALDPSEVRAGLAKEEEFSVEELLDDLDEDELWGMEDEPVEQPDDEQDSVQSEWNENKNLNVLDSEEETICTDADKKCRAKDPSKCPVHGGKKTAENTGGKNEENPVDKPENSNKIKIGSISKERLKHISTGTFKNGELKSGCHGQKGFVALQNQEHLSNVKTLPNGVRIANVKGHHDRSKRERQGQTFFPKDWDDHKIASAVKDVWRKNADKVPKTGYHKFEEMYDGVKITIGFKDGKPDNAYPNKYQ